MSIAQGNGRALRDALERVLSSTCFVRAERTSKLLRFLVEKRLEGREGELKESVIGVEVFGRRPDYDPKVDSTVRSEAVRLRSRLGKYYATEGRQDPIVIDLPKGGYVPGFREAEPPAGAPKKRSSRGWLAPAVASFALAAGALGAWWVLHRDAAIPIAVLPLVNVSQDPATGYFADGLTDEIIRNLSIIDGLAVRSRTSSFAFRGRARNVHDIGKELSVEYVLEGSVLPDGQQLRIDVQFIRVRDDFPVWSGRFAKQVTDVFAIQDEISRGIVNNLRIKLGRGRRRYEASPKAYDAYLRARAFGRNVMGQNDSRAIDAFEQAIAEDASFAPAHAGLAAAYAYRSGLFSRNPGDEAPKMRAAAEKAIQLDPLLAEAHDALGMAYARDARWQDSEASFRRAIELDRNASDAYYDFALYLLWPLNRTDEALKELRMAEKTDPLSPKIQAALGYVLPSIGRYDEAAAHCEKLPPEFQLRSAYLGRARLLQGRVAEAIQILEPAFQQGVTPGSEVRAFLGAAYVRAGRRTDAERMALGTNPFNQAVIFAALGDKERALDAMERSIPAGPFRIGRQLAWPELVMIRNDPRMMALRRRVGLAQVWP